MESRASRCKPSYSRGYAYDAAGRTLTRTVDPAGLKLVTRYEYDGRGQATKVTDPSGVVTETQYDLNGRQVSVTLDKGGLNLRTTFAYDGVGNMLTVTEGAGSGNPRVTQNTWDKAGRLVSATVDPAGLKLTTRYTYDANGNVVSVTDAANGVTRYVYDAENRQTWSVDATGAVARNVYDGDPQDAITRLDYDKLDRLVKSTDAEGFFETYTYNGVGNRVGYVNKLGGAFTYQYDGRGLKVYETASVQIGKGYSISTRFQYDARGNLVVITESHGSPESRVTQYKYDALDRQIAKYGEYMTVWLDGRWTGTTPVETTAYDARGNIVKQIDANGNATAWYYDAANHKTGQVSPTGTLTLWTYDAVGNQIGSRVFADAVKAVAGSQPPSAVNPSNVRETRYAYDANSHLTQTRILNVATGYFDPTSGEDQRGNYFITSGSELVTTREYDGRGWLIATTDPAGNRTVYFYNNCGQKTLEVDAKGYGIAWSINAKGDVSQEIRFALPYPDPITANQSLGGTLINAWPRGADDRVTNYTYDRNGRLISESRLNVQFAQVDANGKLAQYNGNATTQYSYDGDGNLLRKIDANGSQYDFTYDANGRLTGRLSPQFVDYLNRQVRLETVYEYGYSNHVVRETQIGATAGSDRVTVYIYGAGGRLGVDE